MGAPSTMGSSDRSTRTRRPSSRKESRPPFTGLVMNAFMGERKRPTRRSDRIRSSTITIDDRIPRVYPATPSPTFRTPYEPSYRYPPSPISPSTPLAAKFSDSWEADIVDASPFNRGRRDAPIIHDERRRERRSDSTEVHAARSTAPHRARTPSPDYRDVSQREQRLAAEEETRRERRERDVREAELQREIAEGRAQQRRRRQTELHDAEINARRPRPVVEQNSPPMPRGILRHPSRRRSRRDSIIEELNMTERGEQVLREAIAAREAEDRRKARDAEMRRLGRRFEKVVFVDDPHGRRQ